MGASSFVVMLPPSEGKAEAGTAKTKYVSDSGAFGPSLGQYRTHPRNSVRWRRQTPRSQRGSSRSGPTCKPRADRRPHIARMAALYRGGLGPP